MAKKYAWLDGSGDNDTTQMTSRLPSKVERLDNLNSIDAAIQGVLTIRNELRAMARPGRNVEFGMWAIEDALQLLEWRKTYMISQQTKAKVKARIAAEDPTQVDLKIAIDTDALLRTPIER